MEMHSVHSSTVAGVGYEDGVLYVEFQSGGTYAVSGSTEAELQDVLASTSPGAWYDRNVKKAGRSVRRV